MKVKLLKEKMINGELAQPNWVYGLEQPVAEQWIAEGDAVQVADSVREWRYPPDAVVSDVCAAPPAEDQGPAQEERKSRFFT